MAAKQVRSNNHLIKLKFSYFESKFWKQISFYLNNKKITLCVGLNERTIMESMCDLYITIYYFLYTTMYNTSVLILVIYNLPLEQTESNVLEVSKYS